MTGQRTSREVAIVHGPAFGPPPRDDGPRIMYRSAKCCTSDPFTVKSGRRAWRWSTCSLLNRFYVSDWRNRLRR